MWMVRTNRRLSWRTPMVAVAHLGGFVLLPLLSSYTSGLLFASDSQHGLQIRTSEGVVSVGCPRRLRTGQRAVLEVSYMDPLSRPNRPDLAVETDAQELVESLRVSRHSAGAPACCEMNGPACGR